MTADGDEGPPRLRNPRGAGDRLRDELIEAAVRVLAAHGDAERLSIRAVAAEATKVMGKSNDDRRQCRPYKGECIHIRQPTSAIRQI